MIGKSGVRREAHAGHEVKTSFTSSFAFFVLFVVSSSLFCSTTAHASPEEAYGQAISQAAGGHLQLAEAQLAGALALGLTDAAWRERMSAAQILLEMRRQQSAQPPLALPGLHAALVANYLAATPPPATASPLAVGTLATLLPGSGHAFLGRWRDAGVVAMLVWPLIGLSLWAARRRMGPVTVFFALLTTWLWSGTVYSAISLAERGDLESYLLWWQGLWMASGLPGRPW